MAHSRELLKDMQINHSMANVVISPGEYVSQTELPYFRDNQSVLIHNGIIPIIAVICLLVQISVWDLRAQERNGFIARMEGCHRGGQVLCVSWSHSNPTVLGSAGSENDVIVWDCRK